MQNGWISSRFLIFLTLIIRSFNHSELGLESV